MSDKNNDKGSNRKIRGQLTEEEALEFLRVQAVQKEEQRQVFLSDFPKSYPKAVAEDEWQSYCAMIRAFGPELTERYLREFEADSLTYPGSLDTPLGMTLELYLRNLNCLARGRYARSRPEEEMLDLLSGGDAKRGAKSRSSGSEGGRIRAESYAYDSRRDEFQSVIDRKHKENPKLSYSRLIELTASEIGVSKYAIKNYTRNPKR